MFTSTQPRVNLVTELSFTQNTCPEYIDLNISVLDDNTDIYSVMKWYEEEEKLMSII